MQFINISIKCPLCNKDHQHLTKFIDNNRFSINGANSIFLQKLCPECKNPIALRYFYSKESGSKVLEYFKVKDHLEEKLEFLKTFVVKPSSRSNDSMRKLKERQKKQQLELLEEDSIIVEEEKISLKEIYL